MPLISFPVPAGDLFNAGAVLADRARHLRSGTFTWLGPGSTAFTGILVGYACLSSLATTVESTTVGSYGIDGGTTQNVFGQGAVAINRYCATSVQIGGSGIGWGVALPSGGNLPTYKKVIDGLDRMHKDGTLSTVLHQFDYTGGVGSGSTLTAVTNLYSASGSGICLGATCYERSNAISAGTQNVMNACLDFSFDGTYRFSIGVGTFDVRGQTTGTRFIGLSAGFGFVPWSSSIQVAIRRCSETNQHLDMSVSVVVGA